MAANDPDRIKLHRSTYDTHRDDTHSASGRVTTAGDDAVRGQQNIASIHDGGIGADEFRGTAQGTRHNVENVTNHGKRFANGLSDGANEVLHGADQAARTHVRPIN